MNLKRKRKYTKLKKETQWEMFWPIFHWPKNLFKTANNWHLVSVGKAHWPKSTRLNQPGKWPGLKIVFNWLGSNRLVVGKPEMLISVMTLSIMCTTSWKSRQSQRISRTETNLCLHLRASQVSSPTRKYADHYQTRYSVALHFLHPWILSQFINAVSAWWPQWSVTSDAADFGQWERSQIPIVSRSVVPC